MLVSPAGRAVARRYDKMNLVPFGEFVPSPFGGVTQKITTEAGDFAPGTRLVVSPAARTQLGAFICYESVFPHFVRRFAARRRRGALQSLQRRLLRTQRGARSSI